MCRVGCDAHALGVCVVCGADVVYVMCVMNILGALCGCCVLCVVVDVHLVCVCVV